MNKSKGFTLVELMVTVVILGILSSIAVNVYENQTRKQRRSDGIIALTTAQSEMEQYRSDNGVYAAAGLLTAGSPQTYYTVTVAITNAGANYTLTATAGGPQTDDTDCRTLIVDDLGQFTAEKADTTPNTKCISR